MIPRGPPHPLGQREAARDPLLQGPEQHGEEDEGNQRTLLSAGALWSLSLPLPPWA